MKKLLSIVLAIVLMITTLTGCAQNKTVSKTDIINDIMSSDSYFNDYGLVIESSEITQRQTNIEQKTDYVWVSLEASNSDFLYTCNYELIYILYNDGWKIDECNRGLSEYLALTEPDKNSIIQEYSTTYNNCELTDYLYSDNYAKLYFNFTERETNYLTVEKELVVLMEFKPHTLWKVSSVDIKEISYHWDNLCGTWKYTNQDGINLTVDIIEFNSAKNEAKLNYSLTYIYENNVTGDHPVTYENYENKTYSLKEYNYRIEDRCKYIEIKNEETDRTNAEIWFCGNEQSIVGCGNGSGICVQLSYGYENNFWLTKE